MVENMGQQILIIIIFIKVINLIVTTSIAQEAPLVNKELIANATSSSTFSGNINVSSVTNSIIGSLLPSSISTTSINNQINNQINQSLNSIIDQRVNSLLVNLPDLNKIDVNTLNNAFQDYHNFTTGVNLLPGSINELSNTIKDGWSQTNAILQKFSTPSSLFMLSLSATAGAILGSAMAGLVISTSAEAFKYLFSSLHEIITHKKRNLELLNGFQEANKHYDQLKERSYEIEGTIDNLFKVERTFKELKTTVCSKEKQLEQITDWIVEKKHTIALLQRHLDSPLILQTDKNLWMSYQKSQDNEKELLSRLKKVQALLKKGSFNSICDSMTKLMQDLILLETKLEEYRADILPAYAVFFENSSQERKAKNDKFIYAITHADKNAKEEEKRIQKETKIHLEQLEKRKQLFIQDCEKKLAKLSRLELTTLLASLLDVKERISPPIFFQNADYRLEICKRKFKAEHESKFQEDKQAYTEAVPVLIEAHRQYAEDISKNILLLGPNPQLYKESSLAALKKNFVQILEDQKAGRGTKLLQKERAILNYCQE